MEKIDFDCVFESFQNSLEKVQFQFQCVNQEEENTQNFNIFEDLSLMVHIYFSLMSGSDIQNLQKINVPMGLYSEVAEKYSLNRTQNVLRDRWRYYLRNLRIEDLQIISNYVEQNGLQDQLEFEGEKNHKVFSKILKDTTNKYKLKKSPQSKSKFKDDQISREIDKLQKEIKEVQQNQQQFSFPLDFKKNQYVTNLIQKYKKKIIHENDDSIYQNYIQIDDSDSDKKIYSNQIKNSIQETNLQCINYNDTKISDLIPKNTQSQDLNISNLIIDIKIIRSFQNENKRSVIIIDDEVLNIQNTIQQVYQTINNKQISLILMSMYLKLILYNQYFYLILSQVNVMKQIKKIQLYVQMLLMEIQKIW